MATAVVHRTASSYVHGMRSSHSQSLSSPNGSVPLTVCSCEKSAPSKRRGRGCRVDRRRRSLSSRDMMSATASRERVGVVSRWQDISRVSVCTNASSVGGVDHAQVDDASSHENGTGKNDSHNASSSTSQDIEIEMDWKQQRSQAARRLAEISRQRDEDMARYRSKQASSARDANNNVNGSGRSGNATTTTSSGDSSRQSFPSMATAEQYSLVTDNGTINGGAAKSEGARASLIAILDTITNDAGKAEGEQTHHMKLLYVGVTRNAISTLRSIVARVPHLLSKGSVFKVVHMSRPSKSVLDAARLQWIDEARQSLDEPLSQAHIMVDNSIDEHELWEKPINCVPRMTNDEREAIESATTVLAKDRLTKEACRRIERDLKSDLEAMGVTEKLRYDPKLKARGLLDLTAACAKKVE